MSQSTIQVLWGPRGPPTPSTAGQTPSDPSMLLSSIPAAVPTTQAAAPAAAPPPAAPEVQAPLPAPQASAAAPPAAAAATAKAVPEAAPEEAPEAAEGVKRKRLGRNCGTLGSRVPEDHRQYFEEREGCTVKCLPCTWQAQKQGSREEVHFMLDRGEN